jgi:hypothetical protein
MPFFFISCCCSGERLALAIEHLHAARRNPQTLQQLGRRLNRFAA